MIQINWTKFKIKEKRGYQKKMGPRKNNEDLMDNFVYFFIKNIGKEFVGRIKSMNETNIVL